MGFSDFFWISLSLYSYLFQDWGGAWREFENNTTSVEGKSTLC